MLSSKPSAIAAAALSAPRPRRPCSPVRPVGSVTATPVAQPTSVAREAGSAGIPGYDGKKCGELLKEYNRVSSNAAREQTTSGKTPDRRNRWRNQRRVDEQLPRGGLTRWAQYSLASAARPPPGGPCAAGQTGNPGAGERRSNDHEARRGCR